MVIANIQPAIFQKPEVPEPHEPKKNMIPEILDRSQLTVIFGRTVRC